MSDKKAPEHQRPYPMASDDIPNMLRQSLKLRGTYPLLQHQVFSHPKYQKQNLKKKKSAYAISVLRDYMYLTRKPNIL